MIRADDERLRELLLGQELALHEVFSILQEEDGKDDVLRAVLRSSRGERVNQIKRLDPDRVFSRSAIRHMCIIHRLRFLDAGCYLGRIPSQALYEVRQLELRSSRPLMGFKILAPTSGFRSEEWNGRDPMLFVPIGEGHYYLVHRWDKGFKRVRALLMWPLRGPVQLMVTVLLLSLLVAAATPNALLGVSDHEEWWGSHRLLGGFWVCTVLAAAMSFGWFTFLGRFSCDAWDTLYQRAKR